MCEEKVLLYNTTTQAYSVATKVVIAQYCNSITVKNAGNSVLVFDDEQLQPGQSKAIGGNRKEIFVGRKDISFMPATPQPVPRVDLAYVTQKFYVTRDPSEPGTVVDF